jgi:hypothetical protein
MQKTIKIAIAAALVAGASSLAMAQENSNTQGNAAASGGAGTHQSGGLRSGSESNTQKVMKNQNGYQGGQ